MVQNMKHITDKKEHNRIYTENIELQNFNIFTLCTTLNDNKNKTIKKYSRAVQYLNKFKIGVYTLGIE